MSRPTGAVLKTIWNYPRPAAAVLAQEASLDEQPVQDALAQRLAKFKLPKRVIFVEDLPHNARGKVQKNLLRERFGDLFELRPCNCS